MLDVLRVRLLIEVAAIEQQWRSVSVENLRWRKDI